MNAEPHWNQERLELLRSEITLFVKRWIELQEQQLDVLRRLEEALDPSSGSRAEEPDDILRALRVVFPGEVEVSFDAEAEPELEPAPELERELEAVPETDPYPEASPPSPPVHVAETSEGDAVVSEPLDRSLLVLASGSFRAAFPWIEVTRFLLIEEWSGDTVHSLHQLAPERLQRDEAPVLESYLVAWNRNGDETALACERIEGVSDAENAARCGIEVVLRPRGSSLDAEALIEYATQDSGSTRTSPVPLADVPATAVAQAAAPTDVPIAVPTVPPTAALRVLLAVHYLPAQIGLSRAFRARGVEIVEEPDLDRLSEALALGRFDLVCIEASADLPATVLPALAGAQSSGVRIVAVHSRVRGSTSDPLATLGAIERLHHPYADPELARIVESLTGDPR